MGGSVEDEDATFDFETHRRIALDDYARVRPLYEAFSFCVRDILVDAVDRKSIKVHSIEARAKTLESFGTKVTTPSEENPDRPKYNDPLDQIVDLAGVRAITFFPRTVDEVDECVREQFEVVEKVDHGVTLLQQERLGYQSVHYIVRLTDVRTTLPEYERFKGLEAEVQVRTVLQHAWAEIEHDIQYKSSAIIPDTIRRRIIALAGLLEVADREFQAIQDADLSLREAARVSVEEGVLSEVDITPDALRAYLDKRLGPDARMSEFSYSWTARLLRKLGFTDFAQVDEAIADYDDDRISRILTGTRQGQISRFEYLLHAGMGVNFYSNHPWFSNPWFAKAFERQLEKLRKAGIQIGSYEPPNQD